MFINTNKKYKQTFLKKSYFDIYLTCRYDFQKRETFQKTKTSNIQACFEN